MKKRPSGALISKLVLSDVMRFVLIILFLGSTVAGCAGPRALDPYDPLENINRATFASYRALDRAALRPTAVAYRRLFPPGVRRSVRRFLDNLASPQIFANDLLQGRIRPAGGTLLRAAINSTMGIGGLFDVAEKFNLPRHSNDFGKTLATYGAREGPYLFILLLGPSNVRDLSGTIVDLFLNPLLLFDSPERYYMVSAEFGLYAVDIRERNLETLDEIEETSLDLYATIRSISQQARGYEITGQQTLPEELPNF